MIEVFCDGACSKNPGQGGWAAVVVSNGSILSSVAGFEIETTNNRMELLSAIKGVTAAAVISPSMIVFTDSIYVKDGITKWIFAWKKNNWKNGTIKNVDLWMRLSALNMRYQIRWEWVKGHSGNKYNEIVDSMARNQIKSQGILTKAA